MNQFQKLIKFVKKGDIEKVSEILQQATLNINQLDQKSGKSLLQIAMQTQSTEIFSMLISYPGIDIQKPSRDNQLPIQTAIILNNLFYVQKLLGTHNVNPKKKNASQETVLEVAIKNQTSVEIIKKLINSKFDINQPVNHYGNLINLAIQNNQVENMTFLINHGLNDKKEQCKITTLDYNDNTCLILAVNKNMGHAVLAILEYLTLENCPMSQLEKQFFLNAQNKQGNTALHVACIKDFQTIMSLIQTKGKPLGLDPTLRNKKSLTAEDIKKQTQRQRLLQIQLKQKNQQQKRIYLKEKEQQKQRRKQEEERLKIEEKRKKKEEQLLMMKQQQYQTEVRTSKTKWICGIGFIAIIALMYLAILNTIQSKKIAQL